MTEPTPPILSYAPNTDQLVHIGPFRDVLEAEMASVRLNEDGIQASVAGAALSTTLGPVYGAAYAGGPTVLVPRVDEAAARAIIASIEQSRRERDQAALPPCPACGELKTDRVLNPMSWLAFGGFIAGAFWGGALLPLLILAGTLLLLWPTKPRWKCRHCGKRFAAEKPPEPQRVEDPEDDFDADDEAGEPEPH